MIYGFAERSHKKPTWHQLKHAILRNFGGLENIDPVAEFEATMHGIDKGSQVSDHKQYILNILFHNK